MRLTFLAADRPLSKSYALDGAGRLTKTSYPSVWQFTSHDQDAENLETFADWLRIHAAAGHCLLKGNVNRPLVHESRAGSTDANAPTRWACLDVDRLPSVTDTLTFLEAMGCATASHVRQYSSAYGIEPDRGLTCHLMFELEEEALPSALKLWLMWKNLTVPMLAEQLALTKTNTALSWPLDITTCQNDKLLYIAPPECTGFEPPAFERISFVERSTEYLDLGLERMPPAAQIKAMVEAKINELRGRAGLPARKFSYKVDKATGLEVLAKADAATMTGLKRERGFVYFNLNGGDSWGYWHSDEHPEVIRNFKGEPDYLTSELLPEYWATVQQERKERDIAQAVERKAARESIQAGNDDTEGDGERVLVFRDFVTGKYWNGVWQPTANLLDLAEARSELQIQHFLKERGLPEVDFIPVWNLVFDPHSDVRVNFEKKTVNTWTRSAIVPVAGEWPTIRRVLEHCVGGGELFEHYINWLACAYQYRLPNLTAWILHGIQGTGKGLLVNKVLAPLFGRKHVCIKRMEELEDQFNGYLQNTLMVIVDEAQISDSKKSKMIMANLKNQITEPLLSIRRMRQESMLVDNFTNWMFLSNMPDPVVIDSTDRRFNVGAFQTEKLEISEEEIALLEEELPAFAAYLEAYEADRTKARQVLLTEERDRIIQTSKTSAELVAEALTKGMLEVFWEALPSGATDLLPVGQQLLVNEYQNLIHGALNGKARFTRDELRVIFEYLCGDMPKTPTKFTQLLRHKNLHVKMMRIDGRSVRGLEVEWRVDPGWLEERRTELKPRIKEAA